MEGGPDNKNGEKNPSEKGTKKAEPLRLSEERIYDEHGVSPPKVSDEVHARRLKRSEETPFHDTDEDSSSETGVASVEAQPEESAETTATEEEPVSLNAGISLTPDASETNTPDVGTDHPVAEAIGDEDHFDQAKFDQNVSKMMEEVEQGARLGAAVSSDDYLPKNNPLTADDVGVVSDMSADQIASVNPAVPNDVPVTPRVSNGAKNTSDESEKSPLRGRWVPRADQERIDALSGRDIRKGYTTPTESAPIGVVNFVADRRRVREEERVAAEAAAAAAARTEASGGAPAGPEPAPAGAVPGAVPGADSGAVRPAAGPRPGPRAAAAPAGGARVEASAPGVTSDRAADQGGARERGGGGNKTPGGGGPGGRDGGGRKEREPRQGRDDEGGPKKPRVKQQPSQKQGSPPKKKLEAAGPYPPFSLKTDLPLAIGGTGGLGLYGYFWAKYNVLATAFESVTGAFMTLPKRFLKLFGLSWPSGGGKKK